MEFILLSIGLGLAGIDPLGALLMASAIASGMKKRDVVTFGLVVLLGTIALGLGLSLTLGASTAALVEKLNYVPDSVWVVVNALVVLLLWGWAAKRIFVKKPSDKSDEQGKWLKRGVWAISGLFVFSALADPSYLAIIAAAGHQPSIWLALVGHTIWILVSQFMLFVLVGAVMLGKHKPVVARLKAMQSKHSKKLGWIVTGVIIVVGAVFLIDLVGFWASGNWIL